jgi:hypothetical protein
LNVIGGSSLIISRIILESVTLQQTPHQRPWLENRGSIALNTFEISSYLL